MEKRRKLSFIKPLLIITVILLGILVINKTSFDSISSSNIGEVLSRSVGDSSLRSGRLTNMDNNITTFTSGFLKKYVYILIGTSKSENIENGLEFEIINPNGDVVDSGIVYDDKRFINVYDGMAGEWEIRYNFEDSDESTMIDFGYSITSKEGKTWK